MRDATLAGRCVSVPVVDSCECHTGTPDPRVIVLSTATIAALGLSPSAGIYTVEMTLVYDRRP